ncbi:MAG: FtsW/RodA/SpoVE family cell cycle protein [Gemmatimonadales bacterium]|nr:FtsW/RodA/SpoVE family cell cycle protein [Gemmatimonadales bacterium]NIN50009.1 FtsW/RodA/SpoVE family cell cycle protein [Gemmatimonadales bacterium]NIP07473.1 FtsW/RodA/SpoVE family cell cycle protein [Gemmatimonadales bacterium]NIR03112.1 FtsW/RodA/SpoVE family cell cycle protein [Gemmatimonadales bacterium]NIS66824.1 FtsW/RodA/SpoVE family cell cycle protein [Gemmatimonadales bacterium]
MRRAPASAIGVWESRLIGIVAATLVVFGIAAVYGASSIWAAQNGHPGGVFALRQLLGAVLGMALLVVVARLDYHILRRYAWPLLGLVAALLIVPLLPFTRAIAPELNGARRWITIGPVSIQPSELAKLAVVVWAAMLAAKKGELVREFRLGVLPFLVVLVPVLGLIVLEPDLSTATVVALLAGVVLFTAGARIGHFLVLAMIAVPLLWHEVVSVQYRLSRMVSFLSAGGDVAESSWQIEQSLVGIGAGQLMGVGFGEGLQKLGYLPYAYSDFIFSTIGEEWGFLGVILIVVLFGLYFGLGLRIARTAPDAFGMLLATGLTAMIGLAAILHIAVTLALVPTTGLPLPFISYGRSNLLVSLFATGVIMSVGKRRVVRGSRR